jgi:hypothetical protein
LVGRIPIIYDHYKQSYVYEVKGKMIFGFQKKIGEEELKQTSGGYAKHSGPLYVFMQ